MRSRTPFVSPIRPVLWLALLFVAGSGAARAAEPPATGTIVGTVVLAGDGAPVRFANVVETTTRTATTTDERGRFLLTGLPPGRLALRIQALGGPPLVEALELAPGDTARRIYRLAAPAHQRYLEIRDSLAARGQWPPALEPALQAHMREALDVRVFRLDPEHPVFEAAPDPERRIGPWPIVGETGAPAPPIVEELIETLRRSELYLSDIQGARKLCGGFSPAIDVRFTSDGVPVDLLLCYTCGEFSIWRAGRGLQTGDFESRESFFVRFAKRMFPRDPVIKRLGTRARRRSR